MSKNNENTRIAELQAKVLELQEQLKAGRRTPKLSAKVSEKGALSVYGLGRFPVTLYRSQWERLLNEGVPLVKQTIEDNLDKLATK